MFKNAFNVNMGLCSCDTNKKFNHFYSKISLRTSVPAIWIGGEFIGGCNDGPRGGIVTLNNSGELDSMLSAVGAL